MFGLFNSKARVAKEIAEECFAALGLIIDSPLDDAEQEIVHFCNVSEIRYRSEKVILTIFAIERALQSLKIGDKEEIATLTYTEFTKLTTAMIARKPRHVVEELILKIAAYEKALSSDEGGIFTGLPREFADCVDDMNAQARPLLITLGAVTFTSAVKAVNMLVQTRT